MSRTSVIYITVATIYELSAAETEEEEEEQLPPPKQFQAKPKQPPPKQPPPPRQQPPPRQRRQPTDDELYSKANIELLRDRLYQQTRQRLANDLFSY
jgi:hypothetical protein